MKILFITDNFPPEVNAPATRTFEHCQKWVENGCDVTVLTCAPNFPEGKVFDGYKNKFFNKEEIDGIEVIRVWSYITANSGFSKRVLDYISFAFTSFIASFTCRFDVVIATSPQFFTTWSAYAISLFRRKPWVFELRDLWPESIKTVGAMNESYVYKFLERIEMFLYRRANMIVPVTDAFKKRLVDRGVSEEKIKVIPNGCNTALYTPAGKDAGLENELGLQDKFVVGYLGTHGMAHSLDFIIQSIKKVNDPSMHFLFVGAGAKKNDIMRLAKELNLTNVTFLPPVCKEEVPKYLSIMDVCLAPLIKSDTFKTVIPSKIFETAAMGKPILLGVEGQAQQIVENYRTGLCFTPEDTDSFLEGVFRLKNEPDLYDELKSNCSNLVKDFDRTVLADKMLMHLAKI